jgi:hypothetical protein
LTFVNSGNMCNSAINSSTSTEVLIVSPVF